MSVLGFLEFGLTCFDVLAWPLIALVYPIYSSIRAIETNSIIDTQKLNTYWVIFSMILLFENSFMKLLEWFPLWLYMRLFIVFWLVIPHFDGAFYAYKNFVYPCLSMDPQIVCNLFNKRKELSEGERYVKDNGYEAFQKIVTGKSTESNHNVTTTISTPVNKSSKPTESNVGQKDIKAVHVMEKNIETTANQVSKAVSNLSGTQERISDMEISEKVVEVATQRGISKTPPSNQVKKEWTCTISRVPTQTDTTLNSRLRITEQKPAYEGLKLKNETEPKFTQTENTQSGTVAARETKGYPVDIATGREDLESPKTIQKEWTCALCQVTTTCERNLNSHLGGRNHKTAYEALKARSQAFSPKSTPVLTSKTSHQPNKEPVIRTPTSESKQKSLKPNSSYASNAKVYKLQEELAEGLFSGEKSRVGIKVKEKVQRQQQKLNEVLMTKSSPVFCKTCSVRCSSKIDMESHLNGRKHKENVQEKQKKMYMRN